MRWLVECLSSSWKLLSRLLVVSTVLTQFTGCCDTKIEYFRIVRADFGDQIRALEGSSVYICPGESVTLGWLIKDAESASIDNGVGTVALPFNTVTLTPTAETHYTLTAKKGDCVDSKTVDVFVISKDQPISVTAQMKQREPFLYEAVLQKEFYSPNAQASEARLEQPITSQGWRLIKNPGINAALSNSFLPVAGSPVDLVGTYQLSPVDQNELYGNPPPVAIFWLKVACK